jgi:hypothetical protein
MSEIKVNSIKGVGASAAAITINNTNGTCSANLTNNIHNKNVLINSNFAVNQRGTFNANTDEYTLDRWYHNNSGATSTITQQTKTVGTELEGQSNYLKLAVTTGSDYAGIRYRHEDVKTITPGSWTLSFYAKGTNPTGGLKVWCTQDFGTGGSSDVDIANQTLTALTSTWTRQSITITVPSFSGKTINAGSFFQFTIGQYDAGTAAWELNIANVQFEQGSIMTDYEPPISLTNDLIKCKRYYQQYVNISAVGYVPDNSSKSYSHGFFLPVEMRTPPTLSITNTGSSNGQYCGDGDTNRYVSSLLSQGSKTSHLSMSFNLSGDLSNFRGAYLFGTENTTYQTTYKISAEL